MEARLRLLACAVFATFCVSAETVAIRNARVIDGTGAPARRADVLIEGDRIAAVGPDISIPAHTRTLDATGLTLLPGLFDLHTHLRASAGGIVADWAKDLKTYLALGVTSVDDFSLYQEMFKPMRRMLVNGTVVGPRVHMATRFGPPGGHGTENGWGDTFTLEAATAAQAHALMQSVLSQTEARPDLIKVFTDGWRYGAMPNLMNMNEETIAAIVKDAHAAGIKVVTHTVTLDNAKYTVRAGVDSLVHGVQDHEIDDEFIGLMREHNTGYVSTLSVYEPRDRTKLYEGLKSVLEPLLLAGLKSGPALPTGHGEGPQVRWHNLLSNEKRLFTSGVRLGNGTDAGMPGTFHGWASLRELELKVEAGLKPLEALTAATSGSAAILGIDREVGTIAEGKLADLVLVRGNPDEHITDIYKTEHVFLGGREFDPRRLEKDIQSERMAELPVHRIAALLDDFEREDGRTALATLRVNGTDPGIDHSRILFSRIPRTATGHALNIEVQLGPKPKNFAAVHFPLTPGAIELADISTFHGIQMDVRGESGAQYDVRFECYAVRKGEGFHAPIAGMPEWQTIQIPFSALRREGQPTVLWTGKDVRDVSIELSGPPLATRWLEVDNLRFY